MSRSLGAIVTAGEPWEVVGDLERALRTLLPRHSVGLTTTERTIVVPAPHEVWLEGRCLRFEEEEAFTQAVIEAARAIETRAVLWTFDELYPLDWDSFGPAHWAELAASYRLFPGALPDLPQRWLSARDDEPHLWSSVEPPGLQVGGLCEATFFDAWHAAFVSRTRSLPWRGSLPQTRD